MDSETDDESGCSTPLEWISEWLDNDDDDVWVPVAIEMNSNLKSTRQIKWPSQSLFGQLTFDRMPINVTNDRLVHKKTFDRIPINFIFDRQLNKITFLLSNDF